MSSPCRALPLPGIILAAGLSRRMGTCKLLLDYRGRPLLSHCLEAALGGSGDGATGYRLAPLILVRGPHSPDFATAIRLGLPHGTTPNDLSLHLVSAERAEAGQAESLKAGLEAVLELNPHCPGVMVLLGDQPLLHPDLLRDLAILFTELAKEGEHACVAPAFAGKRGNPVILHRDLFPEIRQLTGDAGARSLLARHKLHLLSCEDDACLTDIDAPEDYARLTQF